MTTLFIIILLLLILADLVKGLSANGTPPVLQSYPWQMDLAYFMWSSITPLRLVLLIALLAVTLALPDAARGGALAVGIPLLLIWGGVYWLFNHFWVGRVKFLPITQKTFVRADENAVDLALDVIGVDHGGEQKAFPVNMLFYHHQIADAVGDQPVWATYCGLCRSGRVYDIALDGRTLSFGLVGAITFNAVFRDHQTGTWWRQETGEAAKGPLAGRHLADIPFEQMSLQSWLDKHPGSLILQYDPVFAGKYTFLGKLLNHEASFPGWHRQDTPPLVLGVEIGGHARGYDWQTLQQRHMVADQIGQTPVLVLTDGTGRSGFVLDRRVDGAALDFEWAKDGLRDRQTGSHWDHFGRCQSGEMAGRALRQIQSHKQFIRAWITFHGHTDFYQF